MSIFFIKTFIFSLLSLVGLSHARSHRHRTSTVVSGQNTNSNVYSSTSVTVQIGIKVLPYPTPFCNVGSVSDCKIECDYDPTCQIIGFNQEQQPPCTCADQICSDGQIYSSPSFTQSVALTQDAIYSQPHIVAPCQCIIPAEIAPWKQEIDIGQLNGRQNRWPYMNCQTVPYTPSGQGQGQGNGNNEYYTKAELLDDPKANHGISG